jgi:hypothetical protein
MQPKLTGNYSNSGGLQLDREYGIMVSKGVRRMKYINQRQYPDIPYITRTTMDGADYERGQNTTISSSGCGLCAAIIVADRLLPNCQFGLEDALALSYESKANHRKGTDYTRYAPAFAEKLGLRMETSHDLEDVRRCLRTGGAVVALVKKGLFTDSLHYIAIIGEEPDGRFAILDPSLTDEKYEREDRKGRVEIKNGVIVLCDEANLCTEVTEEPAPLTLFWRK